MLSFSFLICGYSAQFALNEEVQQFHTFLESLSMTLTMRSFGKDTGRSLETCNQSVMSASCLVHREISHLHHRLCSSENAGTLYAAGRASGSRRVRRRTSLASFLTPRLVFDVSSEKGTGTCGAPPAFAFCEEWMWPFAPCKHRSLARGLRSSELARCLLSRGQQSVTFQ